MPLVNVEEIYARFKPVYKGKHPLKVSDVQLVMDSHGCPNALLQHPAFDPVVEQNTFSGPIEQPSRRDVLDLFPAPPPLHTPLPRRPKVIAPPLYDELYNNNLPPGNPAFKRQRLPSAPRAKISRESNHQPIDSQSTSSHRSRVAQAQAFTETALFRDGYQQGDRTLMMHSNSSTKSLGVDIRIKAGPARRVVVNPPDKHQLGAHSGTTRHGADSAEFGYISHGHHKIPDSTSRSRSLKSSYRP